MHVRQIGLFLRTFAMAATFVSVVSASSWAGPTHVDVVMEDSSINPKVTGMMMAVTPAIVKAGQVVFHAINASHDLVHELVLIHLEGNADALPLELGQSKVQENRIQDLGEVSDLCR